MAYVYLNDENPEAEEYNSNYVYFDETDPQVVYEVEKLLASGMRRDAAFRARLDEICQPKEQAPIEFRPDWIGELSTAMAPLVSIIAMLVILIAV